MSQGDLGVASEVGKNRENVPLTQARIWRGMSHFLCQIPLQDWGRRGLKTLFVLAPFTEQFSEVETKLPVADSKENTKWGFWDRETVLSGVRGMKKQSYGDMSMWGKGRISFLGWELSYRTFKKDSWPGQMDSVMGRGLRERKHRSAMVTDMVDAWGWWRVRAILSAILSHLQSLCFQL